MILLPLTFAMVFVTPTRKMKAAMLFGWQVALQSIKSLKHRLNLKKIIIAGPNGAGKTTFARNFLPAEAKTLRFINADLIKLRDQEEPILGAT